jgi:hypothetical protein
MRSNDLLLLDGILNKNRPRYGARDSEGEYFELFAIDAMLRHYDLTLEELEDGFVDGGDDGGIDGFYVFVDGVYLAEDYDVRYARSDPRFDVHIVTSKHADAFRQAPLTALVSALPDLLDLVQDEPANTFNEHILTLRERFRRTYVAVADRRPSIVIRVHYCCRGSAAAINPNVTERAAQLQTMLRALFGRSTVEVGFLGASELLALAQRTPTYALRLPFTEIFISRDGTNFVILCRLKDYLAFITSEDGELRRYLFDANVRDYLGPVQVNANIAATLADPGSGDFWWFNNGITILASSVTPVGKVLSLDNILIVNGLQTTETIFRTLKGAIGEDDDRAVLVKIIISADDDTRARIIKATNYQNTVELAALRSLDRIQRNIEAYLAENGWYYERRRNYYLNQNKPAERICSIGQLGAAVRALAFRTPHTAAERQRWLRHDASYREVFNERWPLDLFLACVNVTRSVDRIIRSPATRWPHPVLQKMTRGWALMVALVVVCLRLRAIDYEVARLTKLARVSLTADEVIAAAAHILAVTRQQWGGAQRFRITLDDERAILEEIAASGFALRTPEYDGMLPLTAAEKRRIKQAFHAARMGRYGGAGDEAGS